MSAMHGATAVIVYGRGDHLGNFEVFARSLAQELGPRYGRENILVRNIERRDLFFQYLSAPPLKHGQQIAELHIFSHSIGGGLFLAYGDAALRQTRELLVDQAERANERLTYDKVLAAEVGVILTDDLVRHPYCDMRFAVSANLTKGASIKIWGCNSGIPNWRYADNGISRPQEFRVPYYWRALNERLSPKPAIAQAFANYFRRPCFGARSGSHIELLHRGKWISSDQHRASLGQWPSGAVEHRLAPDRGTYHEYKPADS